MIDFSGTGFSVVAVGAFSGSVLEMPFEETSKIQEKMMAIGKPIIRAIVITVSNQEG